MDSGNIFVFRYYLITTLLLITYLLFLIQAGDEVLNVCYVPYHKEKSNIFENDSDHLNVNKGYMFL